MNPFILVFFRTFAIELSFFILFSFLNFFLKIFDHSTRIYLFIRALLLNNQSEDNEPEADAVVAPHRVLIFAQMKLTLDLIETHVFKKHLPKMTWLRLDGALDFLYSERFECFFVFICGSIESQRIPTF
jgi:SNF2 family DNA or RNA helicase